MIMLIQRGFDQVFTKVAAMVPAGERLAKKVHFATMELKDNRGLFIRVLGDYGSLIGQMQLERIPVLIYLPATAKVPKKNYLESVRTFDMRLYPAHCF
jgi:hypothetical protein